MAANLNTLPRSACRRVLLDRLNDSSVAHPGLMLCRYLEHPVKTDEHPEARKQLLEAARGRAATNARALYAAAFSRREQWFQRNDQASATARSRVLTITADLVVSGRMAVGLGNASSLEVGIRLDHTYGVPILPGSALKGLAAHFCDQVWGQTPEQNEFTKTIEYEEDGKKKRHTGAFYQTLFGDTDEAGYITFYDAWIRPEGLGQRKTGLLLDVMTPHHSDYYSEAKYQGGQLSGQRIPPTDFDDPIPIAFLSAAGTFHLGIACVLPQPTKKQLLMAQEWLRLAMELLQQALNHWGIGGKTSSGYGRLRMDSSNRGETPLQHSPETQMAAATAVSLPKPGDIVQAKLLADKTRKGGWIALHPATNLQGPIHNTQDVPKDKQPDETIDLIVASVTPKQIAFRYPTGADRRRGKG